MSCFTCFMQKSEHYGLGVQCVRCKKLQPFRQQRLCLTVQPLGGVCKACAKIVTCVSVCVVARIKSHISTDTLTCQTTHVVVTMEKSVGITKRSPHANCWPTESLPTAIMMSCLPASCWLMGILPVAMCAEDHPYLLLLLFSG